METEKLRICFRRMTETFAGFLHDEIEGIPVLWKHELDTFWNLWFALDSLCIMFFSQSENQGYLAS